MNKSTKTEMLILHSYLIKEIDRIQILENHTVKVECEFLPDEIDLNVKWHTDKENSFKTLYQFHSVETNYELVDKIVSCLKENDFNRFRSLR